MKKLDFYKICKVENGNLTTIDLFKILPLFLQQGVWSTYCESNSFILILFQMLFLSRDSLIIAKKRFYLLP